MSTDNSIFSPLSTLNSQLLSWHGLELSLPEDWSPVKLNGDGTKGEMLIADLRAPRMGLRWASPAKGKSFDKKAVQIAMLKELGSLAADEATEFVPPGDAYRDGLLYVEKEPPGRDVWIGIHRASGRLIELILHVKATGSGDDDSKEKPQREIEPDAIKSTLAQLVDHGTSLERPSRWSVFDLSCIAPAGWTLRNKRLNAGDLSLEFEKKRSTLIVRQIGPAKLALARQSADEWLTTHARMWKQMYRLAERTKEDDFLLMLPVPLAEQRFRRRRRYFFARWAPPSRWLGLYHDQRDRLILIDCDETRNTVLESVGWAQRNDS